MALIDKHGTEYEVSSEEFSPGLVAFHVSREGLPIARAALNVERRSITDVVVYEHANRRKGIATALYSHIEAALGFTLVPNRLRLADGKAFWQARLKPQRRALGRMAPRYVNRPRIG